MQINSAFPTTNEQAITTKKQDLIKINEELHNNFIEYISINKLSKKTGFTFRATKNAIKLLSDLKLFNKPICEWHDEEEIENG